MLKGTAKADRLDGTSHSDVFYGGRGSDVIAGGNGRDVAVYGRTAWGKDRILGTKGTMAILFKDLEKSDVVQKLRGTTMTITRKSDRAQSVTVQGWSNNTHSVVFGGAMSRLAAYLKAAAPSAAQEKAARSEVWKKAGLAQA